MSIARVGKPAPRRADSSRTREAKAATLARRQARAIKSTTPALDLDRLALELSEEVAR